MRKSRIFLVLFLAILGFALLQPFVALVMATGSTDTPTEVIVLNVPPTVQEKSERVDGLQVTKCALVCDNNGKEDIATVSATTTDPNGNQKEIEEPLIEDSQNVCGYTQTNVCKAYTGTLNLNENDPAGDYNVIVTAIDKQQKSDSKRNTFFYGGILGISIDTGINFGSLSPGNISEIFGDKEYGTGTSTIKNTGTATIGKIKASATDLGIITKDNLEIRTDTLGYQNMGSDKEFLQSLGVGDVINLDGKLTVPAIPQGIYSGSLTLTALA